MTDMKPKDSSKLDFPKQDKSGACSEEDVSPEDIVYTGVSINLVNNMEIEKDKLLSFFE